MLHAQVCGHVYDPAKDGNGVPFEQLPDTWVCPVCGAPKSKYKKTVDKAGRVQWAHGEDEPQRFNASCIGPKVSWLYEWPGSELGRLCFQSEK